MKSSLSVLFVALVLGAFLAGPAPTAQAAGLTPAHRRQLSSMGFDIAKVGPLIRKKDTAEAEKLLEVIEGELAKIMKEAMVDDTNITIAGLRKRIATERAALAKALTAAGTKNADAQVSFEKDVAPILKARCLGCHGARQPRGGLRMDTFAGIRKGGQGGAILDPGKADRSRLVAVLNASGDARMPKGAAPLGQQEIQTISIWINQGAKFDGGDETVAIGEGGVAQNTVIPRPTGSETVSFTKDIAPFFANLCLRCHQGGNPRGGFSMQTFESMMRGGKSGRVILPGNLEGSRLFRLTGGLEDPRMPNDDQSRITRKNYNDLRTWILEGAKFDGRDAKMPLKDLVPSEEDIKTVELSKLSDDEFLAFREKRNDELWDRVLQRDRPRWATGKEVIVYGNASTARLSEVATWAETHVTELKKQFGDKSERAWKGKLTIFLLKDRFGFDEFNLTILKRQVPPDVYGTSVVTPSFEDAYVILQDVGDDVTGPGGGVKLQLADHLTGAYLKRKGGTLPDWVVRGTGLAVAAKADAQNEVFKNLRSQAPAMVQSLGKPDEVFANGTFSPSAVGTVGFVLVEFMIKAGGPQKYVQFVSALQQGGTVASALKSVYQSDPATVAGAFAKSFGGKR